MQSSYGVITGCPASTAIQVPARRIISPPLKLPVKAKLIDCVTTRGSLRQPPKLAHRAAASFRVRLDSPSSKIWSRAGNRPRPVAGPLHLCKSSQSESAGESCQSTAGRGPASLARRRQGQLQHGTVFPNQRQPTTPAPVSGARTAAGSHGAVRPPAKSCAPAPGRSNLPAICGAGRSFVG